MANNSLLGYALLGLLHQQPFSGYDLRKIFASSPIGGFSDSPGAIYPALRRLEERGMVSSDVQRSNGLRTRRVFKITPRGLASFKTWQSKPIAREDVMREFGELLLRFAFMDQTFGPKRAAAFLREFAKELSSYISQPTRTSRYPRNPDPSVRPPGPRAGHPRVRGATRVGEKIHRALRTEKEEAMMNLRIGLYCLLGGLSLTIAALGAGHFVWWWLSGILVAAAFVPVARFGLRRVLAQFCTILLL